MKKFILLALTAMSLLAASSSSFAWGYGHRGFYGPTIGIGIGVGDPFYYGPGPYYYAPPPPVYYAPPPVYVEPQQTYVERADASAAAPDFRYFCASAGGYYPQVPSCPKGWMKVVPDNSQPR